MKPKFKILSYNYTGASLVVLYSGPKGVRTCIVTNAHLNWTPIIAAYKAGDMQKVIELGDVVEAIQSAAKGEFKVVGGKVFYAGEEVHGFLFEQILSFVKNGLNADRLVKFANNLWASPDTEVRTDLYKFLANRNMPITDDGCFMAYKGVAVDYFSVRSAESDKNVFIKGTIQNKRVRNYMGDVIEIQRLSGYPIREECFDYGIHIGTHTYADGHREGGHLMIVKVNPQDVVGIPHSASAGKIRVIKYEVVAEEGQPLDEVQDVDFNQTKVAYHNKRDASGKFAKA